MTETYIVGRRTYQRPQAVCFSENPGTVGTGGMHIPDGQEFSDFIVLSDHNRSPLQLSSQRIEKRQRTINGRMRSYWTADKLNLSTSWDDLPSRGWINSVALDPIGGYSTLLPDQYADKLTVDGGAGGNELLQWYRGHQGSFWVFLAYDRYPLAGGFNKLRQYNEVIEMFFGDFSYSVKKRSSRADGTGLDLWDIEVKLEEA